MFQLVVVLLGIPFFPIITLWLVWVFPYTFQMLRVSFGGSHHIFKLDEAFGFEEAKMQDSLSFGRGSRFISYSRKYIFRKTERRLANPIKHRVMIFKQEVPDAVGIPPLING
ncbi:hypothetical protein [Vibrio europaeus]|uniref:Uncharacterized protein n=1 Tax=Vibrio europaeus TaxID=300876 RepID=A0A178J4R0_9VIBR|nr:hypothetical protein [Vibrio europaeus]OAM96861.1 hypothetical protein AZ468_24565 [Vibrio europaeus]